MKSEQRRESSLCRVGVCRFVDWSTEAGRGRTWRSSASVHLSLRMLGLTLWRQRCAHCWPVRPGISAATAAHRLPCLACSRGRNVIAQKKFLRCGRCRCVRYGAYLKCGELDVFDVGPWRTLEVYDVCHRGIYATWLGDTCGARRVLGGMARVASYFKCK